MTDHKKIAIKNNTNLAHEFVGNNACILKEKTLSPKKGSPLEPAHVGGNLYNWYENFSDTHKKGGWYNLF